MWTLIRLRPQRRLLLDTIDAFSPEVSLIVLAYNKLVFLPGKVATMNWAMQQVQTFIAMFTDTNMHLSSEAVERIVQHFQYNKIGIVASKKRIQTTDAESARSSEGLPWKYESQLKRWNAELYTIAGSAGELFTIRTELHEPVLTNTILNFFIISPWVAGRGFRETYESETYAFERPSFSILDEPKRKKRIAAGGFLSMVRPTDRLNPLRHGWLTFEYVSQRLMRWAISSLFLLIILLLNVGLVIRDGWSTGWGLLLIAQFAFYGAAALGYLPEKRPLRWKTVFVPFYLTFINVCALANMVRYLRCNQFGAWEKVCRVNAIDALT